MTYFFSNFVLTSSKPFPGFFEFLPQLYDRNLESVYLRYAVEAISMASLAQVNRAGDLHLQQARKAYGRALNHLGTALNSSDEAGTPAVLATVYLLWKYCVRPAFFPAPLIEWPTNNSFDSQLLDHNW